MGRIGADTDQIRHMATQLRGAAEQIAGRAGSMNQAIDQLATVWQGGSRERCLERWRALEPMYGAASENLAQFAEGLEHYAESLEQARHQPFWKRALGFAVSGLGIVGSVFSFIFPPVGLGLQIAGGGLGLAANLPDLVRTGDWRGLVGSLTGAIPFPTGAEGALARDMVRAVATASNPLDAVQKVLATIPAVPGTPNVANTLNKGIDAVAHRDPAKLLTAAAGLAEPQLIPGGSEGATIKNSIVAAASADSPLDAVDKAASALAGSTGSPNVVGTAQDTIHAIAQGHPEDVLKAAAGLAGQYLPDVAPGINGVDPAGVIGATLRALPPELHVTVHHALSRALPDDVMRAVDALAPLTPLASTAGFNYDVRPTSLREVGSSWFSAQPFTLTGEISVAAHNGDGFRIPWSNNLPAMTADAMRRLPLMPTASRHLLEARPDTSSTAELPLALADFFGVLTQ